MLSPGGFAHVYLVKTQEKLQGRDLHVLKRVAVRDRKLLDEVRREVEVMVSCCFFRCILARRERRVKASAPDRREGNHRPLLRCSSGQRKSIGDESSEGGVLTCALSLAAGRNCSEGTPTSSICTTPTPFIFQTERTRSSS